MRALIGKSPTLLGACDAGALFFLGLAFLLAITLYTSTGSLQVLKEGLKKPPVF